MSHPNNIPKLRFPEFSGEWEEKKLGKLSTKIGSGSTPLGGEGVYQKTGVPFIRSQNVVNNSLLLDDTCISEHVNQKMKGSIVKANDVLLNITGGSIGRSCVVPKNFNIGNVNQHVSIIRLEHDSPKFLQSILSSYKGQKLIFRGQTGSGREGLNFQSIRGFKIAFPSLPEQQKIASFLTALDTKIEQLTKKKSLLEQYKKGVMQRIFPPAGGQVPEIRFKASPNDPAYSAGRYPDWEEKKLGEVAEINPKGKDLPQRFIYIDLESVNKGQLVKESRIDKTEAPSRAQRTLLRGDVLFQMVRPYQRNNFHFKKDGDYVASTGYAQLRAKRNEAFLFQALHTEKFVVNVMERCTGTSYPAINPTDLGKIKMMIPNFNEQAQIANFLTAIDDKIDLINNQLENTQQFKKGLLQQMFV